MSQPSGSPAEPDAAQPPAVADDDQTQFATRRRPVEPAPDVPRYDIPAVAPQNPAPDTPVPPVARLAPPTRAVEPSRVAADYVTHQPAPGRPVAAPAPSVAPAGAAQPPVQSPAPAPAPGTNLPVPAADEAPAVPDPDSIGGLGDQPEVPIVTLPPIADEVAGYPLSTRTGEPVRGPLIVASMASFGASALVAMATYWWYWWVAINIENFGTSAKLIELFDPRPGSAASVVLVCVMAVIGVIMTAGPGVAAYNVWHGASWSRVAGIVACVTSLLAFFVLPWSWLALGFAAIGTLLIWLPQAKPFFTAWQQFANPLRAPIVPPSKVAYGPAPRFR